MPEDNIQNNRLELMGRLTASLMHEIRNSLSALNLNLEFLLFYKDDLPKEVNETIESSIQATNRISSFTENLLQFARKNDRNFDYASLNQISLEAMDLLKIKARKKNVEIVNEFDERIPDIFINRNNIFQVMMNLIINAVDASYEKGIITVRTYKEIGEEKTFYIWEVEDTGKGIADEDKAKIFSEFFTSKKDGTGLGLNVCKKILEKHKAELTFSSELGSGSKFSVKFDPKLMETLNDR
jgi:two-component system NtrC family sensor kinase